MNDCGTMKQVIARLRGGAADALHEIAELEAAVRELLLSAHRVAGAAREIAAEAQQLSAMSSPASPERQRALASYAQSTSVAADGQARALEELKRAIEDWTA